VRALEGDAPLLVAADFFFCNSVSNECYNSGLEGVDDVEVMVLR
jgi:hypothetical protein